MTDEMIIDLYFARNETAVSETAKKYGERCTSLARAILRSQEDAEECLSDACLRLWDAIPPQRPQHLGAFLLKITRNLACDRLRSQRAEKRGDGELPLILDELSECVGSGSAEEDVMAGELSAAIRDFLDTLPPQKRRLFLGRYFFASSVGDLAKSLGISPNRASVMLLRMREALKNHLTERGFAP
ncbi:MAG: sigma-70 family RNA polymerase sigma factor [Oscillospiraceae bacterium]|nr:sigma-70 family RNA polymerase sigma factor [Oscillospiraceae bacterium]